MDRESDAEIPNVERLKTIIGQRQREMNDLNEYRFKVLENIVRQKEGEHEEYHQKYDQLKRDFEYNLTLLEGRDEELRRYDDTFNNLKKSVIERDSIISEIKSSTSELEERMKKEQQRSNDLEIYYQEKLQELKTESQRRDQVSNEEYRRMCEEYERVLHNLKQSLLEKDQNSEKAMSQFRNSHNAELGKKEEIVRSLQSEIQDYKLSVNKLENEKSHQSQLFDSKSNVLEKRIESLETQLKNAEVQYQNQVKEQKSVWEERTKELESVYQERLSKVLGDLDDASNLIESKKLEVTRKDLEITQRVNEKDDLISSLRQDVEHQLIQKDHKIEKIQSDLYRIDLEKKSIEERNLRLQKDLDEKIRAYEQMKDNLNMSIQRENQLKKEVLKVQLEKEKDREIQNLRRRQQEHGVIEQLRSSKSQLQAELAERTREVGHLKLENEKMRRVQAKQKIASQLDRELGFGSLPPPSPVPSLPSTLMGEGGLGIDHELDMDEPLNLKRENDLLKTRNSLLEDENRRVRDEILDVKTKLERSVRIGDVSLPQNDDYRRMKLLEKQVDDLREELAKSQFNEQQLRTRNKKMKGEKEGAITQEKLHEILDDLRSEFDRKARSQSTLNISGRAGLDPNQLTKLNSMLTDLRIDYEKERDRVKASEENVYRLNRENSSLKSKLKIAASDVKKILKQREKLIDLNNMYKSELTILKKSMKHQERSQFLDDSDLEERRKNIEKYKVEISRLGEEMNDLKQDNTALKRELFRWTNQDRYIPTNNNDDGEGGRRRSRKSNNNNDINLMDNDEDDERRRSRKNKKSLKEVRDSLYRMDVEGSKMPIIQRDLKKRKKGILQKKRKTRRRR